MTMRQEETANRWYQVVKEFTLRLVNIRSVSPSEGENQVAREVLRLLLDDNLNHAYTTYGLDPIENDPYQRHNAYAFLRGQSPATLILLGHFDTVDIKDYGPLEPLALDPLKLTEKQHLLLQEGDETENADDWLFGRGVVDMKSGVAVNIALMRCLAEQARSTPLPISVLMLATPDEENESAGVLQAVRFLQELQARYQLSYVGVINTDYTKSLYPGDPHHYIYTGTIGKLLPSFLCIGRASHVGDPFNGIDANLIMAELIRDLSMNDALCDTVRGQITSPPVTLHATDLKTHYNVQLPFVSYFYLNVLTFTSEPKELLERLRVHAQRCLARLLTDLEKAEQRWQRATDEHIQQEPRQAFSIVVTTYAELYNDTVQRLGRSIVDAELDAEWKRWPATLDKRERSRHLVSRLWTVSGRQGPAVILYYAPPYYPHVAATPCALQDAIETIMQAHPEEHLVIQEYFPYLSDLSYLRLDTGINITALKENMPVWQDVQTKGDLRPGAYHLPLEAIRQLNIPVVNFGVHGRGAHQRDESVLMSYSFGALPQLLYETIEQLALLYRTKSV